MTFPVSAALPRTDLTPGATNPAVTQATLKVTICVRGYSASVRPPESYTEPLKRRLIRAYGFTDRRLGDYELDHLISLELGGSPADPRNLFPEPHNVVGGWGSYAKDRLENKLHWLVCHRGLRLATAQEAIRTNWIAAYRRYVGPKPENRRSHRYGG
ncbi:MAG: hypothetical protein KGH84_13270 [Paracoccaceae bacterium]|nr:hypothetical protein [Paracoccaceae bacterium]